MNKTKEALEAYQQFNRIRNDLDAYLYALGAWALSGESKPDPPVNYGIPSPNQPLDSDRESGVDSE
ncbi:MAG: hypothetical protein SRB1_00423 [Desulfobacteraceae bacterium Eth-SRB1]|nr:MAG: hypothetical protein SRB1_00423 [Desulfobacteraceae bacterium Eth-SRB1]